MGLCENKYKHNMSELVYPCSYCDKNVVADATECFSLFPFSAIDDDEFTFISLQLLSKNNEYWYCKRCSSLFPFSVIDDDEFTYIHAYISGSDEYINLVNSCKTLQKEQNDLIEYNVCDFKNKIDPNKNFFASIENSCSYYTPQEFNKTCKLDENISVIPFNCRSIKANFENLKTYIWSLDYNFDIIAISETWLCDNDSVAEYPLENYKAIKINRNGKRGGGVMLYISNHYEFEKVMSYPLLLMICLKL